MSSDQENQIPIPAVMPSSPPWRKTGTTYQDFAGTVQRRYSTEGMRPSEVEDSFIEYFRKPNNLLDSNSPPPRPLERAGMNPAESVDRLASAIAGDHPSPSPAAGHTINAVAKKDADSNVDDALSTITQKMTLNPSKEEISSPINSSESSVTEQKRERFSFDSFFSHSGSFKGVKNRNTNIAGIPETVFEKRDHIGKIMLVSGERYIGLASGIRLSSVGESDIFLCTRHSIGLHNIDDLIVGFEILNYFHEKPDPSNIYRIEEVLGEKRADIYQEHRIHWDPISDLVLLKIQLQSKLPGSQERTRTGNQTYIRVRSIDTLTISTSFPMFHLGYASVSHLKASAEFGLRLDSAESIKRGDNWLHTGCVKDNNPGIIDRVQPDTSTCSNTVTITPVKPGGRTSTVNVSEDGSSAKKLHKNGNTRDYKMSTLHIVAPHIHGGDHLILSLSTKPGSSGGGYFDMEGNLIAVHIGAFLPSINKVMGLPAKYHAHVALLPTAPFRHQFLYAALIPEKKPQPLSAYSIGSMKIGDYLLSQETSFSSLTTIGIIEKFSYEDETSSYLCQIINPTLHLKQLRIKILEDQRLVIYNADEDPDTGSTQSIFICKESDIKPENRISIVPSLLRILQYGTAHQTVIVSSDYSAFLNDIEKENRIVDALRGTLDIKKHADMDETCGKVSHSTYTWGRDDYASFHFVECGDKDGENGRNLFVIGIGTHIDERTREDYAFENGHWTPVLQKVFSKNPKKPLCIKEDNRLCTFLTSEALRSYSNTKKS